MDGRYFMCLFCLLVTVSAQGDTGKDKSMIKATAIDGDNAVNLTCDGGIWTNNENFIIVEKYGEYTCTKTDEEDVKETITVKFRRSEDLIQLDTPAFVSILLSDIAVTALIGWAIYSICAQPKTKSSYQGNKASDRQVLINHTDGQTYQPLSAGRTDEYSTLHGARKNKRGNQGV
ncbi:T-cell surface glycoprotein CD3 gamma chain-like [Myxocyprinus asiaticus]|uniref:T-cell surface glycoprotein CD3 gamma chain-like n=1 Tax=Myxocyprinus asiaticus TaxID=70543 RepID=UPI0022212C8C|nr:T-cell surface glycoprotein CD3 gamma chain-like [Myxocyprinus asiaticus]